MDLPVVSTDDVVSSQRRQPDTAVLRFSDTDDDTSADAALSEAAARHASSTMLSVASSLSNASSRRGTLSSSSNSRTMSVHGPDDVDENAVRCLHYWPTGSACLRFYAVLFFSAASVTVPFVYFMKRIFETGDVSDDCELNCIMTQLITTTLAFWMQPPTIGQLTNSN